MHAYVGDEVIVSWPVSDVPAPNARCVACFFAIESKIARLAPDYEADSALRRPFAPGCTPVPSLSANAATPNASSPISATR